MVFAMINTPAKRSHPRMHYATFERALGFGGAGAITLEKFFTALMEKQTARTMKHKARPSSFDHASTPAGAVRFPTERASNPRNSLKMVSCSRVQTGCAWVVIANIAVQRGATHRSVVVHPQGLSSGGIESAHPAGESIEKAFTTKKPPLPSS